MYPIVYNNCLINKTDILKNNKNKIGIYRWVNIITNESYVGSSINITKRLRKYYSINYLESKTLLCNSRIYRAILKYGHSNFNLEILEYCTKESLIDKEQFYIDIYSPEYNICKKAGSMLGFRHSLETLLRFKNRVPINSHEITLIDIKNKTKIKYSSIRSAAKNIGVSHTTLLRYINKNKIIKEIYLIDKSIYN
jgi:hypothetical protein